jgi:hypothetical protein
MVLPSGGAACAITWSMPVASTTLSITDGRIAKLTRPNSAANHTTTTAGNSLWLVTDGFLTGSLRVVSAKSVPHQQRSAGLAGAG